MRYSFKILPKFKIKAQEANEIEQDGLRIKPTRVIPPHHNGNALSLFNKINQNESMTASIHSHCDYNLNDTTQYVYNTIVIEKTRRPQWWDGDICHEGGLNDCWVWRETKPNRWTRTFIIPQQSYRHEDY